MTPEAVRTWLAKRLSREAVPDDLWEWLDDAGYVRDVVNDEESARENIVRTAKRFLQVARALSGRRSPPGRSGHRQPAVALSSHERERANALAEHLTKQAAVTPRVAHFRAAVLSERVLNADQARAFLTSPATRFFTREQFSRWKIPLVNHTAELVKESRESNRRGNFTRVAVRAQPPGVVRERRFITWEIPRATSLTRWEFTLPKNYLMFLNERGLPDSVTVAPGSVLDDLRDLSAWLAERCGWEEPGATWFLLTDAVPHAWPLQVRLMRRPRYYGVAGTISLTVEPWVTAETVRRVYRRYQREMLGGDNRPMSERNLALFRFVTKRTDAWGRRPQWRRLMVEWNRSYGHWRYDNERLFARDHGRAERALLLPRYRIMTGRPFGPEARGA